MVNDRVATRNMFQPESVEFRNITRLMSTVEKVINHTAFPTIFQNDLYVQLMIFLFYIIQKAKNHGSFTCTDKSFEFKKFLP